MAITVAPYKEFIMGLGRGDFDFTADTFKLMLLSDAHTPAVDTDDFVDDVVAEEITGTGYTAGGFALSTLTWTYDAGTRAGTFGAAALDITDATFSARYAVIYKSTGSNATSRLVVIIDFGGLRTYAAEDFQYTFTSGVVKLTAVVGA